MFDGPENFGPDESGTMGNVSEEVSEQAREQFAQAQAAIQQVRREEKKAKKKDDGVAQMILQFLTDTQKTHLATLIARLVANDCPSPFILAILSLINDNCKTVVEEYLSERAFTIDETQARETSMIPSGLPTDANETLIEWIMRMETVLATNPETILRTLLVDEQNIDGTVLQLTTFVFRQFLDEHNKAAPFENVQQLSIGVLQSIFAPHMQAWMERQIASQEKSEMEE